MGIIPRLICVEEIEEKQERIFKEFMSPEFMGEGVVEEMTISGGVI